MEKITSPDSDTEKGLATLGGHERHRSLRRENTKSTNVSGRRAPQRPRRQGKGEKACERHADKRDISERGVEFLENIIYQNDHKKKQKV